MVELSVDARNQLIHLAHQADSDILRKLLSTMIHAPMNAEVDVVCAARHGERSAERVNHQNGYRSRSLDTRWGTLDVGIPRVRQGSYLPDGLFEPRHRAEGALVAVVAECDVMGASPRKVEGIARSMGIQGLSKSQVSEMTKSLDAAVESFRTRVARIGATMARGGSLLIQEKGIFPIPRSRPTEAQPRLSCRFHQVRNGNIRQSPEHVQSKVQVGAGIGEQGGARGELFGLSPHQHL